MKTDDLQKLIEEDSKIDETRLDFESLRVPSLHAKYFRIYMDEAKDLKALTFEVAAMKKNRTHYYLGKAPEEEYVKERLDMKVIKSDLDVYLSSDEKIMEVEGRMIAQKMKVEMVEKFLSLLSFRNNTIKTALDFMKFKNGEF